METPTHSVIIPTSGDKAHSANAFDMVHSMNLSGLEISYDSKQILNNLGQEVVLCIAVHPSNIRKMKIAEGQMFNCITSVHVLIGN